jgi:hypothetical protein
LRLMKSAAVSFASLLTSMSSNIARNRSPVGCCGARDADASSSPGR